MCSTRTKLEAKKQVVQGMMTDRTRLCSKTVLVVCENLPLSTSEKEKKKDQIMFMWEIDEPARHPNSNQGQVSQLAVPLACYPSRAVVRTWPLSSIQEKEGRFIPPCRLGQSRTGYTQVKNTVALCRKHPLVTHPPLFLSSPAANHPVGAPLSPTTAWDFPAHVACEAT